MKNDERLICKICNEKFNDSKSLHYHVKKEGFLIAEYYQKFYPKLDLHTGKSIKYKNVDQYFSSDFNSRSNFLKWFVKNLEKTETKEYCYNKLLKRIKDKNLKFAPSHVELCSLQLPNILGFSELGGGIGDYLNFCRDNKLKCRYSYIDKKIDVPNKEIEIIIDSREKLPLIFNCKTIVKKLDFGDYAIADSPLAIERKSLADLTGTLSGGFERFKKEIERSGYLVVLVEELYKDCLSYYPPSYRKFQKASGAFIFHRIRELYQSYDNIQFLFVQNKDESAAMCKQILQISPNKISSMDLQWLYDKKMFNVLC